MIKRLLPVFALIALLAGCASERVVLLPSADGRPSAVVVRDAQGEQLLDQPYAGVVRRTGENRPYESSAEEVRERFGAVLAAQPERAKSWLLYFETGGNALTAESQQEFAKVRAEILRRAASEVMVIGHTDRVGNAEANEKLSKQRAELIRDQLVDAGVPADKLETVGRGERDPLVQTADEVDEPKNRRVEISVR